MDLFSLVARLTLDRSGYEQGINEAESEAKSFGDKLKSGLGTAAKVGAGAIAAVGTAAVAMGAAVVKQTGEIAAFGDNIDKASQKLGISAEAYQEWDAVLQHSGTSIDSMGVGMKTLASKAASGSDAFKALGISAEKAAKMSREDLFAETITALQNITDENARAQLAQELFGRSAMELGPLLNTSAEETQAMRDRVHELGGVMSDEAVKAAAKYQDSLQDMTTALDGLKRNMLSEFLPGLTSVMDGLTDIFAGGDGVKMISSGIDSIIGKISDLAPRMLEVGSKILMALSDAIVTNLPKLMSAAGDTVMTLVNGALERLPEVVKAGLEIIVTLAQSITKALPTLIPTIAEVVMEIVDTLTDPDSLSQIIDAALELMIALAEGLIEALPKLIEKAPEIIMNLVEALLKAAPKVLEAGVKLMGTLAEGLLKGIGSVVNAVGDIGKRIFEGFSGIGKKAMDWGKDMIDNFTEGIKAFINKPLDAIGGLASKIKKFLGFSEPEEGPLSNFHTYAPDMMKLFAEGIHQNQGLITDAINSAFALPGLAANNAAAGQEFDVPRAGTAIRDIIIPMYIDGKELARVEVPYIEAEQNRIGIQLAGVMG